MQVSYARLQGPLVLEEATLTNLDGPALDASYLTIDSAVWMKRVQACGQVWLMGAHIAGDLYLSRAHLRNPDRSALAADSLTVGWSLLAQELVADGTVGLIGARMGARSSSSTPHCPDRMVGHYC